MSAKDWIPCIAAVAVSLSVTVAIYHHQNRQLQAQLTQLEKTNGQLQERISTKRLQVVDSHSRVRAVIQVNSEYGDRPEILLLAPDGRPSVMLFTQDPDHPYDGQMIFNSLNREGTIRIGHNKNNDVDVYEPDFTLWGMNVDTYLGHAAIGVTDSGRVWPQPRSAH